MDQPRRFRVHEENGVTTIEWRWVGAQLLLAPAWLGLVCGAWWFWYYDAARHGPLSTGYVCFLAAAALLPIAAIYLVLAKLCNRSRLIIEPDTFELRQGPLPWPGNGRWSRSGFSGFIYKESTSSGRGGTLRWYTVYALWRGSRQRRIAGDLRDENEAIWLATTLDRRFGYDRELEKPEPPVEIRLR